MVLSALLSKRLEDYFFLSASFIYYNPNGLDFMEKRNDFLVGSFPVFFLLVSVVSP